VVTDRLLTSVKLLDRKRDDDISIGVVGIETELLLVGLSEPEVLSTNDVVTVSGVVVGATGTEDDTELELAIFSVGDTLSLEYAEGTLELMIELERTELAVPLLVRDVTSIRLDDDCRLGPVEKLDLVLGTLDDTLID
jgi:hypothetical protein